MYDLAIRGAHAMSPIVRLASEGRADRRHRRGGPRTLRDPPGVHGVFVNGVRVFDGADYIRLDKGPGSCSTAS
jgi:hypothetical protein